MDIFFLVMGMGLCILVLFVLYRVVYGPGVFNRVAALSAIGNKTLIILLIMFCPQVHPVVSIFH